MRTLKIVFCASLAGWLVGFVGSSLGTMWMWTNLGDVGRVTAWEAALAGVVAVAILPVCVCVVTPLTRRLLREPAAWPAARALKVGGGVGVVAVGVWLAAAGVVLGGDGWGGGFLLFLLPCLFGLAFFVGATTGVVGVRLAKVF